VGEPKKKAPGSLAVEVAMWFFFCLPGFIYTIWRNTCPLKLCAHCGSQAIIPTDSPNAQAMLEARAAKGLPALPVQTKKSRVPRSVWLILAAFIVLILILVLATRATPP